MKKIGEFIYPWGNGHYSRMMRLNKVLPDFVDDYQIHFSTKSPIYEKLVEKFPDKREQIHEILMPTPIDGKMGPSLSLSMLNVALPISKNPPLIKQISSYLKEERRLYDTEKFDLVINDGDMGSNVLAYNRNIPSLFVTNQFMPRLWKSRFYFYPSLVFVAKQIAKATKILVADSSPPYTMCEYNLNFPEKVKEKVIYVGNFTAEKNLESTPKSDLEKLIVDKEFGYWMRTGNKSTNEGTGQRYNQVFSDNEMRNERRIISHATNDPSIDSVLGQDGKKYGITEALEKKIDWIQIDVGFLSEQEKDSILEKCRYAVINGSHTVMGEILGEKSKPIIGMPIYDEHTNQLAWAQEKKLGVLAKSTKQVISAIKKIKSAYSLYEENLAEFSQNFDGNGAKNTALIVSEFLEKKK
ncbi:MAG: glycosyltransferase [Crenarchaeota archaeon]|nr:MAG: glycosyltransferase [Thermoproteota archaeon]RDJ34397.1 MAG: glycosyltransferase [Thermoproteota archaeon]RDJ34735.1 MAG: glycosyltransferase [Thermoproteota archaeon]RDJ38664.1 MAG: glycosyltransferase [Thermoproteota archaeon]